MSAGLTGKQWADLFEAAAAGVYRERDDEDAVALSELLASIADDMRGRRGRYHLRVDFERTKGGPK